MAPRWFESANTGVVVVSLGHGDLLLESIQQVAREASVHTGVLMTGIGSLSYGRIHSVVTNDMPPRDKFFHVEGPLEIVGFRGIIADGDPHIHISLMDAEGKFYGGHLEPGCIVLTLSEISLLRLTDLALTRRSLDGGPIKLLDLL